MIQKVYDILGITSPTIFQEQVILIFSLVLLFFGTLVIFNATLNIMSNIFKIDS